jgi:hypothetical protein
MSVRTCDDWRRLLREAQDAKHAMTLNGRTVGIRDGNSELRFSSSADDGARLDRLIAEYQAAVDACNGMPCVARRVMRFSPV